MKTSYYLTPDLRQKLVGLNFRDAEGKINLWNDQLKIIEQDPSKGEAHQFVIFKGLMDVLEQFAFISEEQDYTRP